MNRPVHIPSKSILISLTAVLLAFSLSGCKKDLERKYDIPESQADCPANTDFRSGGGGIVDRSGGGAIVDRDSNPIVQYCEPQCQPGESHVGDAGVVWTPDNDKVTALRVCQ